MNADGPAPRSRVPRWGLRTLLALGSALLVAAAVLCVSLASAWLLHRLAEEQALARVELAAKAAEDAVTRAAERTETAVRLLAERPTLTRLLTAGDAQAVMDFLTRFRDTGGYDGCIVWADGARYEAASLEAPAPGLSHPALAGGTPQLPPAPGLHYGTQGDALEIVAAAPLALGASGTAVVTRILGDAFSTRISQHVGLDVRIVPLAPGASMPEESRGRVGGTYRTTRALRSGEGSVRGSVEASLSVESVAVSVRRLIGWLLVAALLVAAAAAGGGVLLGRALTRPMDALAQAARRIGRGDLVTPIPRVSGEEVGRLAATMEEMRGRLQRLTVELKRRESEAQVLLEGIVEGVFAVDAERRIRYVNNQAAALLEVAPEEAMGKFCGDVLRPVAQNGVRPCESRCPIIHARSLETSRAVERRVDHDGRPRTLLITSSAPIEERQVQLVRDETDLEGARRARDAILANISHEFKTPLSAQLASLELLRDSLADPHPDAAVSSATELVLSLERSTVRLTQLVDNLLESVRVESGEASIRTKKVSLEDVVEEAVEMIGPLLRQREQRVVPELPYPLPSVMGDAPRLTQVFVNLLDNASKYSPERSVIRIGGETCGDRVTVWVDDEGPGLPNGADGLVFDRFFRSAGSEPDARGVGLGLWIVKSIVSRHGGSIEARRRGDLGTRIAVTLPTGASE
jgi:signal transduction histidine kinase